MPITFDSENKIFHLTTPNSSYIFTIEGDGILIHTYYGKKLSNISNIKDIINYSVASFSAADYYKEDGAMISSDMLPQEYPFYGSTDLRSPAFHASYKDGSRITDMKYVSHKIFSGKPALLGLPATYTESDDEATTLELEMKDDLTGLEFTYRYTVFENYDAIARSVTARNRGGDNVNISAIASCSVDFLDADFDMVHLSGCWARERHVYKHPLTHGFQGVDSKRTSSSHHHSPFLALARKNAGEENGEVYGFSLVYSGNFRAGVEVDAYAIARVQLGINPFDFSWLLEPGASFTTPEVVMVYSGSGFGKMSRTYHKLYRTRLARGYYRDTRRPILINNWEATYFDFNEEKILNIARRAKDLGIELMVLDDGWFGKRENDRSSLGDWVTYKKRLPKGVEHLAKRITDEGMRFGLWFEPEMISVDSDLYRSHPDWCIHVEGRKKSEGRFQLVLDLTRSDVRRYIIDTLSYYLENAPISYIKWDMNRNITEHGSAALPPERQGELGHRYILGIYEVLETLTTRFPKVLFEGCSGGGGRFDAGMIHYFSQYWTSDDTDAVERLYIQYGSSMFLPPVTMSAHISAVPNHQTGRVTPMKLRGNVAIWGQFGYELDLNKLSDEDIEEVKNQIALCKEYEEVFHKGDMYRLASPFEGDTASFEFISEDKNKVIMIYCVIKAMPHTPAKRVKFAGLEEGAVYKDIATGKTYGGDMLMNAGLLLSINSDYESVMMVFEKI